MHYIYYTLLRQVPTIITKYFHLKMKALVQSSGGKKALNELGIQRPTFAFALHGFSAYSWNATGALCDPLSLAEQWELYLSLCI